MTFDEWWDKEQGGRMAKSQYLARKAWKAALLGAAKHFEASAAFAHPAFGNISVPGINGVIGKQLRRMAEEASQ